MKKLIFLILLMFAFYPNAKASEKITINVPDGWRAVIEDSVINLDDWIFKAVQGKYSNSSSRVIKKEIQLSIEADETLPAGEEAIIQKHFDRPDYKNRKEKEEEKKDK